MHGIYPGNLDAFKEHSLCNFEYLLARLGSSSIQSLVNDLEMTFASVLDADIYVVLQTVVRSKSILSLDALQLANELIGHLRQLKGQTY